MWLVTALLLAALAAVFVLLAQEERVREQADRVHHEQANQMEARIKALEASTRTQASHIRFIEREIAWQPSAKELAQ
jgi:cell division protein FtsL